MPRLKAAPSEARAGTVRAAPRPRSRPRCRPIEQNRNEVGIALGVAAVEFDRAFQLVERPVIISEMHRHVAEQGVSAGLRSSSSIAFRARFSARSRASLGSCVQPLDHRVRSTVSQSDISGRVVRIERDRALEQVARLRIGGPREARQQIAAAQDEVVGFEVVRGFGRRSRQLEARHPDRESAADAARDLILNRKDVLGFGVVFLRPQKRRFDWCRLGSPTPGCARGRGG